MRYTKPADDASSQQGICSKILKTFVQTPQTVLKYELDSIEVGNDLVTIICSLHVTYKIKAVVDMRSLYMFQSIKDPCVIRSLCSD